MSIGPGSVIGGYYIERVLGAGGMGTVYLAKHPALPRRDAIKVLSTQFSADAEFRTRFQREANLAAALDHPNIVSVYNRGEENGQLWIAMQYVDGVDADAAMKADPRSMTPHRALRIIGEVGRGLDHAHRRGLLHRDIKPANFLLSQGDGDEERVLLTDFGVAKSTADTSELTQAGSFVATIAYAAPEQLTGGHLDHRSDIYGLACSFFKLATGRNPYPGAQPAMVMMAHLTEPPPRISAVMPGLPPALDEVLAVAMDKDPEHRFDTCHEFTKALESAMHFGVSGLTMHTLPGRIPLDTSTIQRTGPRPAAPRDHTQSAATEQTTLNPARRPNRKRIWIAAAAAAVAVALAAGIGIWSTRGTPTDQAAPTQSATPTPTSAPTTPEEARRQNPAFEGKTIAAVDISGTSGYNATVALHLKPSPQATFFQNLGFVYHPACTTKSDEPTPRPIIRYEPSALDQIDSGYLLAVRSDTASGGGGLVNLPNVVQSRRASVMVLDDPAAVEALRNWTDQSERILLEKLVPVLRKSVK
ncbi:serine/threonine-protein kinase [Nocardia inohanensis]|uniref:serine/threonine-protein kinase n=1 Tax=Nocardia inohanensis TaxID=209246 RepID=UPI000831F329|nr:serine/threonine-protein kinase [Nocardia inohanensis]